MILQTLLSGLLVLPSGTPNDPVSDVLAIRVGRAETISHGTIENAVILVEDGKIVAIGEDLAVGRGIPIADCPDWVATPGLIDCNTRTGLSGRGSGASIPQLQVSKEIYPRQDIWKDILETGVTTLGLAASGTGIPGKTVAVRPRGDTAAEMIIADDAYLTINLQSNATSKKMLRGAFKKLADYDEKLKKAKDKWEKAVESAKKKKSKEDQKKADPGPFVAPTAPADVAVFQALREKELTAMVRLRKSSDYLHFLDVVEDQEDFNWFLHMTLRNDVDFYRIAERVGKKEMRVVMPAAITLMPNTRRERNIAADMQRAGAKIVLLPRADNLAFHKSWMRDVGFLVAQGLDRQAALAGMTLQAAHVLGLEERMGSLEKGKDANLVLWDGDPFEPETQIKTVILEGQLVFGEFE
jgi:imidazolonepropionase-like amidohydrolase